MNNAADVASLPQVNERIKSLFESARRYRLAREARLKESQPGNGEHQLELGFEVTAN